MSKLSQTVTSRGRPEVFGAKYTGQDEQKIMPILKEHNQEYISKVMEIPRR